MGKSHDVFMGLDYDNNGQLFIITVWVIELYIYTLFI
jgi:hypothetical protein